MSQKPFLVVSDLHLGAVPDSTETSFRQFLDAAIGSASGLLINGDLFEFGIAYKSVIPSKHYRVLAKLADLVDAGVPVYFSEGNHDRIGWGGHALREAGVTLLEDRARMELCGRRSLVAHGDSTTLDGRPTSEQRVGRNRGLIALVRSIHPDWIARVQPYTTSTRRQVQRLQAGLDSGPKRYVNEIEAWAREELRRDASLELVVAGHCHLPAIIEVDPGRYYLNAGDWIYHYTFLEIQPGEAPPQLKRWPADKIGAPVDRPVPTDPP